jgi:response regulator RpfG family c-di-GMP phosphodiesterase
MASEQTQRSRLKILLVDDDDLVRAAIEDVLSDAGFEVVATANPHEALGLPDAIGPPGVVITDIDLSSLLNGFDVAAGAHLLWPTAQVILISGLPVNHTGRTLGPRPLPAKTFFLHPFARSYRRCGGQGSARATELRSGLSSRN